MILSVMMFALGVFASSLLALLVFGAYARRTRRITHRRLLERMAVGRAEIDAERDELRARHAVEVRRFEREIGHLRDQATAFRLDGDVKEQELSGIRAEQGATLAEVDDLVSRLDETQVDQRETQHLAAEQAGLIRTLQFELEREHERREMLNEAVQDAEELARQRWKELEIHLIENRTLESAIRRLRAGEGQAGTESEANADAPIYGPPTRAVAKLMTDPLPVPEPTDPAPQSLRAEISPLEAANDDTATEPAPENSRTRERKALASIKNVSRELHRIATRSTSDLFQLFSHAKNLGLKRRSDAQVLGSANLVPGPADGETVELRLPIVDDDRRKSEDAAEEQIQSAINEIRSLSQAGE